MSNDALRRRPVAPDSKKRLVGTRRPRSERAYLTKRAIARHLLAGLPAVLAAAGLAVLWARTTAFPSGALPRLHLEEGLKASRRGQNDRALVYLQRVAGSRIDDLPPRDRLEAARRLFAMNEPLRAGAILNRLAPSNAAGYPPAQVFLASRLLDRPGVTRADHDAAEVHLLRAVEAEPQYVDANARLVQVYINTGRGKQAIAYLERASTSQPELLIVLARIEIQGGERARAMLRLKQARSRFETRCEAFPDDHDARIYWGEAALAMEDFADAATILKEGFARSDDPRYGKVLGRLYLAWHDAEAGKPSADLATRLGLLEQGLRYDPHNLLLLDRFSDPIRGGGEVAARAMTALREQVDKGRGTAAVHYVLGVAAFENGRLAEARAQWEEAHELSPEMPFYANNYAHTLAMGPDPDPAKALGIIRPIVERWPKVMVFRDTRGQILAKLGRWYDARDDLEEALRIGPPTVETHQTLAEVYEHLQDTVRAEEHRQRSRDLATRTPAVTPNMP